MTGKPVRGQAPAQRRPARTEEAFLDFVKHELAQDEILSDDIKGLILERASAIYRDCRDQRDPAGSRSRSD